MKPVIKDNTVMRIEKTLDKPVSHSMDADINSCLDELDELRAEHNGPPVVRSCDRMEELVNG